MFEDIAKEISEYLLTGMHHSTPDGQKKIAEIVGKRFIEKSHRTPSEIAIFFHQQISSKIQNEYSI